jgi:hypothetical protein
VFYERSVLAAHAYSYLLHVIRIYADNFHITKLITSACKLNSEVTVFISNGFSILFHFSLTMDATCYSNDICALQYIHIELFAGYQSCECGPFCFYTTRARQGVIARTHSEILEPY